MSYFDKTLHGARMLSQMWSSGEKKCAIVAVNLIGSDSAGHWQCGF